MRATDLWVGATNTRYSIHGSGTEPTGTFTIKDEEVHPDKSVKKDDWLRRTIQCISLCNNSSVQYSDEEKKWERIGDPTEVALMLAAMKLQKGSPQISFLGFLRFADVGLVSSRRRQGLLG
jgi:magnesium-transporting ATPase (P-type)